MALAFSLVASALATDASDPVEHQQAPDDPDALGTDLAPGETA